MSTTPRTVYDHFRERIEQEARLYGYSHPEHLSGPEYPATDIACIPVTIAEQIAEGFLYEPLVAALGADR